MMTLRNLLFFALVTSIWAAGHYYVGRRLLRTWHPGRRGRRALWAGLAVDWALGPVTFLCMPMSGAAWADAIQWVGFTAMGAFATFFVLFLSRDGILGAGVLATRALVPAGEEAIDRERRRFLANSSSGALAATATGLTGVGLFRGIRLAEVQRVEVPIPDLPPGLEGLRIAQISDIHVGPTVRRADLEAIVARVSSLEADLIAVTGDLVDGTVARIGEQVRPLGALKAPLGTYFCTGNHEYYSGVHEWCDFVRELGIEVLINEHRRIDHRGATLLVAGVPDYRAEGYEASHRFDPAGAKAGAGPHDVALLLAHQPRGAQKAAEAGYDLQLSGHTHGGQFFPFTWLVHLAQPFAAGLHRLGKMALYVNRGTTYWGPPLRLGAPQEITLLTLVRDDEGH